MSFIRILQKNPIPTSNSRIASFEKKIKLDQSQWLKQHLTSIFLSLRLQFAAKQVKKLKLLNFPGSRSRKIVHSHDIFRNLKVGEMSFTELFNVFSCNGFLWVFESNESSYFFAHSLIRYSNYLQIKEKIIKDNFATV